MTKINKNLEKSSKILKIINFNVNLSIKSWNVLEKFGKVWFWNDSGNL